MSGQPCWKLPGSRHRPGAGSMRLSHRLLQPGAHPERYNLTASMPASLVQLGRAGAVLLCMAVVVCEPPLHRPQKLVWVGIAALVLECSSTSCDEGQEHGQQEAEAQKVRMPLESGNCSFLRPDPAR